LLARPSGDYVGTTSRGGAAVHGLVFRLVPPSAGESKWRTQDLYSFAGDDDGSTPVAQLIADPHGNLYGTTSEGATKACEDRHGCGTVFELSPPRDTGSTSWIETILYRFHGGTADGQRPVAGLYRDRQGNLYGTTETGGVGSCFGSFGCGTIFKLTPPAQGGAAWTETVLHFFTGYGDGAEPAAQLVPGPGNWLYGTSKGRITNRGAPHTYGTVFRIRP